MLHPVLNIKCRQVHINNLGTEKEIGRSQNKTDDIKSKHQVVI